MGVNKLKQPFFFGVVFKKFNFRKNANGRDIFIKNKDQILSVDGKKQPVHMFASIYYGDPKEILLLGLCRFLNKIEISLTKKSAPFDMVCVKWRQIIAFIVPIILSMLSVYFIARIMIDLMIFNENQFFLPYFALYFTLVIIPKEDFSIVNYFFHECL